VAAAIAGLVGRQFVVDASSILAGAVIEDRYVAQTQGTAVVDAAAVLTCRVALHGGAVDCRCHATGNAADVVNASAICRAVAEDIAAAFARHVDGVIVDTTPLRSRVAAHGRTNEGQRVGIVAQREVVMITAVEDAATLGCAVV